MTRWTRRRFLASTAATACVGCAGSDDAVSTVSSRTSDIGVPAAVPLPGLGAPIVVGSIDDLLRDAQTSPVYASTARAWVVAVADDEIDATLAASDERLHPGIRVGLMALHQKCPHLGCRVPFCESSGWFECACHGSKYTHLGEHRDGPGPRGLDAFPIIVSDGIVSIEPGEVVPGHPVGTVIVDSATVGPSCVSDGEH